jgi:hypothetical protein
MSKLLDLLQKNNLSVITVATKLKVATSQVYRWDRIGINPNNPHYRDLLVLVGEELETTEPSKKAKITRPPKQLDLVDCDLQRSPTKPRPTGRPRVIIRPKARVSL